MVLARAFYSDRDTRTPVVVAMISVGVNVFVSVVTVGTMGLAGLALGIAIGAWFDTLVLGAILWRRTHAIDARSIYSGTIIFSVGSLLAGVVAYWVVQVVWPRLVGVPIGRIAVLFEVIAASAAAGLIYLLYSRLMRIPEMASVLGYVRSELRRIGTVSPSPQ